MVTGVWELWRIRVGLQRVFKVLDLCDRVFESRETLDYLMRNIACWWRVTPCVRSECPVLVCRDHWDNLRQQLQIYLDLHM